MCSHVEHVLGVFFQICKNRSRHRCISVLGAAVVVLLVELDVVTDYLAVPVML